MHRDLLMRILLCLLLMAIPSVAETLGNESLGNVGSPMVVPSQASLTDSPQAPSITVLTQIIWKTQYLSTPFGMNNASQQDNSWIFPGLPQLQMGEKVKGAVLSGGFILTGIGSLVSLSVANNAYQDSQTIWKEAMELIDLEKRAEKVKRSYEAYDRYNSTLMMAGCLGVSAVSIWAYSALDSWETKRMLKRSGIQLQSKAISFSLGLPW
jgi:hypothetical protein